MSIFLSKFFNKIDKKNRVSIPASYRVLLGKESLNGIVVYPSFKNNAIEACSMNRLQEISKIIEKLDPYSEERDAFETIVLGEAVELSFDSEGRVILPQHLVQSCNISSQVCFVGKGRVFEIWNPDDFNTHLQSAKKIAEKNRMMLKNSDKLNQSNL